jgi:hypothetical protein
LSGYHRHLLEGDGYAGQSDDYHCEYSHPAGGRFVLLLRGLLPQRDCDSGKTCFTSRLRPATRAGKGCFTSRFRLAIGPDAQRRCGSVKSGCARGLRFGIPAAGADPFPRFLVLSGTLLFRKQATPQIRCHLISPNQTMVPMVASNPQPRGRRTDDRGRKTDRPPHFKLHTSNLTLPLMAGSLGQKEKGSPARDDRNTRNSDKPRM